MAPEIGEQARGWLSQPPNRDIAFLGGEATSSRRFQRLLDVARYRQPRLMLTANMVAEDGGVCKRFG